MKASHNLSAVAVSFDEDNLVPNAGLVGPAMLAQKLGIAELVDRRVRLDRDRAGAANSGAKAATVVGAMLAGGDSCQTYGLAKQGCRFGYTKVRGLHPLLATVARTGEVAHVRMRGGDAGSAHLQAIADFPHVRSSKFPRRGTGGGVCARQGSACLAQRGITSVRETV